MEVWRILRKETGLFFPGVYPSLLSAAREMRQQVRNILPEEPAKVRWQYINSKDAFATGTYYHKDFNLDWICISVQVEMVSESILISDRDTSKDIISPDMISWTKETNVLQDGFEYDIRLGDDTIKKCTLDEKYGMFIDNYNGDLIPIEEVVEFKGG